MKELTQIGALICMFNMQVFAGGSDGFTLKPTISKSENSIFCKDIKKKMRTIVSGSSNPNFPNYEIDKYFLWPDRNENGESLFTVDIDNDGELDDIKLSSSGSAAEPSDPCSFTANLSSGNGFDLSGWNIRLMKYRSKFYLMFHQDDELRRRLFTESPRKQDGLIYHPEIAASIKYQLYELISTDLKHSCSNI